MENPQDKKGHNTTYTCPRTTKRIYTVSQKNKTPNSCP